MREIWTALVLISILNYSHKMKSEKAYNPSKKNPNGADPYCAKKNSETYSDEAP